MRCLVLGNVRVLTKISFPYFLHQHKLTSHCILDSPNIFAKSHSKPLEGIVSMHLITILKQKVVA